jgi:tetratricopeptide (TPR) repeat protein
VLNLVLALLAGVVITVAIKLFHFPLWAGLIPGAIAFLATYLLLARRILLKVQALMAEAQKELQGAVASVKARQQKVERAVKIFEGGLAYGRWQFTVEGEVQAQIGMLKYMAGDHTGALPHLLKTSPRNYMARALLGALAYKQKEYAKMRGYFEEAIKSGKKEPLMWAAYAWCLTQLKENDDALKVMSRAVEANPNDEKLKAGLTALQNRKKLKMRAYEPLWWQFGLEQPPMELSGGRQIRFQG